MKKITIKSVYDNCRLNGQCLSWIERDIGGVFVTVVLYAYQGEIYWFIMARRNFIGGGRIWGLKGDIKVEEFVYR